MKTLSDFWYGLSEAPGNTWQWFNGLDREEWMVVLAIVCVCGFVCMLGFRGNRL